MIVDYNLELAKLVLAGKINGKFFLKTCSEERPFRILALDRVRCNKDFKGIGLYLSDTGYSQEESIVTFDSEDGITYKDWKILIDLTDFEVGGYVSCVPGYRDMIVSICSGCKDDLITVSCWSNICAGTCENTHSFSFKAAELRPSTQEEIDNFLKIIKAKGKEVRDGKLVDICKEFTPFERVLVHIKNYGWVPDLFAKKIDRGYYTTAGRIMDEENIVSYNAETKHLLES